jgi:hypothetical protein
MKAWDNLILIEIDKYGFIVTVKNNFDEAKLLVDKLFKLSDKLSYDEIIEMITPKSIAYYKINGNQDYAGRVTYGFSNGLYSVSLIKIDPQIFCIKTFIKERQNYSSVFNYKLYDKELDRMAELFPRFNDGAN